MAPGLLASPVVSDDGAVRTIMRFGLAPSRAEVTPSGAARRCARS